MSEQPAPEAYFYPNKLGRIILLSLEEVLGRTGLKAVLNLADLGHYARAFPPNNMDPGFTFSELGAIHQSLDRLYGPRAGRGLALRAGRVCFRHGLREFGPSLGISDLSFRLLPLAMKIKTGAEALVDMLNEYTDQVVRFEETESHYLWRMERCALCWGRQTGAACCHMAVGLAQEALFWLSGGKHYLVEEAACVAAGDEACVVRVARQAID